MSAERNIISRREDSRSAFAHPDGLSYMEFRWRQAGADYRDPSYYRNGFPKLYELEQGIAHPLRVPGEQILVFSSGMSAIVASLESAKPTKGTSLLHGEPVYGGTRRYIQKRLVERGVEVLKADPGDIASIDKNLKEILEKRRGKDLPETVVFFETVGNGPNMPVLDMDRFFTLESLHELNPLIVLDNTLPTNALLPLSQYIADHKELNAIGLESLTKFYFYNEDMGGVAFTPHPDLKRALHEYRVEVGTTPSNALVEKFLPLIPDKVIFDREIAETMRNTKFLAEACVEADGAGKKFRVGYPLPGHPNYDLLKDRYPDGVSPIFFIQPLPASGITSDDMFLKLEEYGAFEGMEFTESFGFGKTTVSHDYPYGGYVRIAGGLEPIEIRERHKENLQRALSRI